MNKVMLFAHLKENAGKSFMEINAAGKTVKELRAYLEKQTSLGS